MDSYTETFGSWQSTALGAAVLRMPVFAASYDATGVTFAGTDRTAVATSGLVALGQPQTVAAKRTHNSINRPGSPPRGRHR